MGCLLAVLPAFPSPLGTDGKNRHRVGTVARARRGRRTAEVGFQIAAVAHLVQFRPFDPPAHTRMDDRPILKYGRRQACVGEVGTHVPCQVADVDRHTISTPSNFSAACRL